MEQNEQSAEIQHPIEGRLTFEQVKALQEQEKQLFGEGTQMKIPIK